MGRHFCIEHISFLTNFYYGTVYFWLFVMWDLKRPKTILSCFKISVIKLFFLYSTMQDFRDLSRGLVLQLVSRSIHLALRHWALPHQTILCPHQRRTTWYQDPFPTPNWCQGVTNLLAILKKSLSLWGEMVAVLVLTVPIQGLSRKGLAQTLMNPLLRCIRVALTRAWLLNYMDQAIW